MKIFNEAEAQRRLSNKVAKPHLLNPVFGFAMLIALFAQGISANPALPPIIDAHESVEGRAEVAKLQEVMGRVGLTHVVLHAVPEDLVFYKGVEVFLDEVEHQNALLESTVKTYPEEFSYFCSLDPLDPLRESVVEKCLEDGALGVKLYNGYSYAHVMSVDDPDLNEFYEFLAETGLPLMLPVNTAEYGTELENLLTLQPDLTVICPHFCLSSKNLKHLTGLLESFPNLYVDTSFGSLEYAKEGFATVMAAADDFKIFFKTFQDRIVFGTDNVLTSYEDKTADFLTALFSDYLSLLTEGEFVSALDGATYQGLDLPYFVQRKVLYQNWKDLTR